MLRSVHFFICLVVSFSALPQGSPQTWQAEFLTNLQTNQTRSYSCTFKIFHDDRIEWLQGSHVQDFPITSTEGTLPAEGNGSIIYHLNKEGKYGKLIIERIGEDVFLTIDLTRDVELGAHYRFKVSDH